MKSARKHELQTNELADAMGHFVERIKPHARFIGYGVAAVLVAVIVLVTLPALRGGSDPAGSEFNQALLTPDVQRLRDFVKDYPSAVQTPAARLLLAQRLMDQALRTGGGAAPDAKAKAAALVDEAKGLFEQVAQTPSLEALARVGLALVAAQQGDVGKARTALEEVPAKWPQSIAADAAKGHLTLLAAYKPVAFSNEPLEEPKKPEAAKAPEAAPAAPAKAPETAPAAAPKAPEVAPAAPAKAPETKTAPNVGEKKPATKPVG